MTGLAEVAQVGWQCVSLVFVVVAGFLGVAMCCLLWRIIVFLGPEKPTPPTA